MTRWNHVGHAFVVCSNAIRSSQHSPHQFLIDYGVGPSPDLVCASHGATNEAPTGGQRKESHGISLFTFFLLPWGQSKNAKEVWKMIGRCSEISEGNETSHLKGVDNSTRLWQLDTATGQALRPQTTASAIERICPKFNSYNACLASCIICLTKEFCPRLLRWRMQHNTLTQL